MPYVKQEIRDRLNANINNLILLISRRQVNQAGQINYVISRLLSQLLHENGLSYTKINEFIGVLECAKLELYRRLAVDYEIQKCKENGEVFK